MIAQLPVKTFFRTSYYQNSLVHIIKNTTLFQTGFCTVKTPFDTSIYGILYGMQNNYFDPENVIKSDLKNKGIAFMTTTNTNQISSEFCIVTPNSSLDFYNSNNTIFGEISEGQDIVERISESEIDGNGNLAHEHMILRTIVLVDPFPDLPGLSSQVSYINKKYLFRERYRIEEKNETENKSTIFNINDKMRQNETMSKAILLEMIGDLPNAEVKPPSNVLFVCKLNSFTVEEDLELIFSQCGKVVCCDIIRDWKTGESLNYGFIGFESTAACERAYFKMNNIIIDDRRIKVDFSQSVSNLWKHLRT